MNSINLLPQEIKSEYASSKKNRIMVRVFLGTLVMSSILAVTLYSSKNYLNSKGIKADKEIAEKEESIKKYGTLEEDAARLEKNLKNAKKIINEKVYFTKALAQIWSSVPPQVYLTTIEIEKDTSKRGIIHGSAENKNQIAIFMEALEDTESFEYVDLDVIEITDDPYLEVEKENFTINFIINEKDIDEKS